jgi:hypothetical protein
MVALEYFARNGKASPFLAIDGRNLLARSAMIGWGDSTVRASRADGSEIERAGAAQSTEMPSEPAGTSVTDRRCDLLDGQLRRFEERACRSNPPSVKEPAERATGFPLQNASGVPHREPACRCDRLQRQIRIGVLTTDAIQDLDRSRLSGFFRWSTVTERAGARSDKSLKIVQPGTARGIGHEGSQECRNDIRSGVNAGGFRYADYCHRTDVTD